jgi:hypothetical protein
MDFDFRVLVQPFIQQKTYENINRCWYFLHQQHYMRVSLAIGFELVITVPKQIVFLLYVCNLVTVAHKGTF